MNERGLWNVPLREPSATEKRASEKQGSVPRGTFPKMEVGETMGLRDPFSGMSAEFPQNIDWKYRLPQFEK